MKYYIYVLERNGVEGVIGILEYPKLNETLEVVLTDNDRTEIAGYEKDIEYIITSEICPGKREQKQCKHCSYFDFCWSEEGV